MPVFEQLVLELLGSELATTITYVPDGCPAREIKALVGSRDTEGRLGQVSASHDIVTLMVKASDVPEADRGDRFIYLGQEYVVRDKPSFDDLLLELEIVGYRDLADIWP